MLGAAVLVLAGCGSDDDPTPASSPTTGSVVSAPPTAAPGTDTTGAAAPGTGAPGSAPQGSDSAMYKEGDIDEGLRPFIDQATADLAARLGVSADDVEVWSAVLVTWPDASLGCPQPDMQYAQVTTDGSIIELSVDGVIHRYHSGGSQAPFLCDQPLDRKPPAAG